MGVWLDQVRISGIDLGSTNLNECDEKAAKNQE
jgi:hypothetical protein